MFNSPLNRISPLSPKRTGGQTMKILLESLNYYNAWSSENVNISGTTTTLLDLKEEHDLSNPSAATQPLYIPSDPSFNRKPSFDYNGGLHYFEKNVSNYLSSKADGEIHVVILPTSSKAALAFSSSSNLTNRSLVVPLVSSIFSQIEVRDSSFYNRINLSPNINTTTLPPTLVSSISTGSEYRIFHNGVEKTISPTPTSGANDGKFFSSIGTTNKLSIGAVINTTIITGDFKWVFTCVTPLLSDANRTKLMDFLINYYGL